MTYYVESGAVQRIIPFAANESDAAVIFVDQIISEIPNAFLGIITSVSRSPFHFQDPGMKFILTQELLNELGCKFECNDLGLRMSDA